MVGIGVAMAGLVFFSLWLRMRGRLYDSTLFLRFCVLASPLGFLAVLAGWTTTETGRQPWTVYGLLRTADSVSPSLKASDVFISLTGYAAVYLVIFPAGFLLMRSIVRKGFAAGGETGAPIRARLAAGLAVPPPKGVP